MCVGKETDCQSLGKEIPEKNKETATRSHKKPRSMPATTSRTRKLFMGHGEEYSKGSASRLGNN